MLASAHRPANDPSARKPRTGLGTFFGTAEWQAVVDRRVDSGNVPIFRATSACQAT
jgi:hypothetical protein